MIKVSIVVPVYNVEKYLDKCLSTLVHQTLSDIEVIVVNDGSTDNSQSIIDKYSCNYPDKIKAFQKANGGLADARNFGVPFCQGEYIAFLDSDDFIESDTYDLLYSLAKMKDSDIVVCDIEYIWENDPDSHFILSGLKNIANDIHKNAMLSPLFAWNKIYKRSFFNKNEYKYPFGLWYEDLPVTLAMFIATDKIDYVNKPLIHYLQRETSIMGATYNPKMFDIFKILDMVSNIFEEKDVLIKYKNELEYLYIEHLLLYGQYRFLRSKNFRELTTKAFVTVNHKFPNWRKNLYIKYLSNKEKIFLKTNCKLTRGLYREILLKWS